MDVKVAALHSRALLEGSDIPDSGPENPTGRSHLIDMCKRIESGEITGEKAHRWLGWVQGALCTQGAGTLAEFKDINHRA